jgi:hypothetical protein
MSDKKNKWLSISLVVPVPLGARVIAVPALRSPLELPGCTTFTGRHPQLLLSANS